MTADMFECAARADADAVPCCWLYLSLISRCSFLLLDLPCCTFLSQAPALDSAAKAAAVRPVVFCCAVIVGGICCRLDGLAGLLGLVLETVVAGLVDLVDLDDMPGLCRAASALALA